MDALLYEKDQDFVNILENGRRKDLSLYRSLVIEEAQFRRARAETLETNNRLKKQYAKQKKTLAILSLIQGITMATNIGFAIHFFTKGESYSFYGQLSVCWAFVMLTLIVGNIIAMCLANNKIEQFDMEESIARLEDKLNSLEKIDEHDFAIAKKAYESISSDSDEMLHAKKDILDEKLGL